MTAFDLFLLLGGLLLAVGGPLTYLREQRGWERRSRSVAGVIVGVEMRDSDTESSVPTRHARVRYEFDGRSYECVAHYGTSWRSFELGEAREVHLDPHEPQDARVHSDLVRRIETVGYLGAPVVGAALLVALLWRNLG
ncbi:DUF3592 domain-containing protein [Engelhardtia mirabilis]|uniref:DUF3592 domain-containing protein n=1 Tax=Engelhardtia mirabilis TaxID=2528011 RepID=A0A518BFZ7_9BACT|nr:hypothetical protein Pla133_09610 [Planctomycetes bacterium Pla133]QDV00221.1 hypothetical protein Pla86_09600 [Planctomycetes bacterium Pla86]